MQEEWRKWPMAGAEVVSVVVVVESGPEGRRARALVVVGVGDDV